MGAASEAAWPGARGTGETEQSGSGRRFTGVTSSSGNSWRKIAEGAGALQAMAGAGRQSARDRRGDPGRQGSAGDASGRSWRTGYGWQRVSLGKEHSEAVRGIESKAGEFYRVGLEGSEKRARDAARTDGISVRYGWRRNQFDTFKYSMLEERLEQVREIDGELAYGKMRRALEKASQEKASQEKARQARQVERARQVESARRERAMQETARQSRAARRALGKLEKRRPERGGPERTLAPAASLVLLRGRERMGRTDWRKEAMKPRRRRSKWI